MKRLAAELDQLVDQRVLDARQADRLRSAASADLAEATGGASADANRSQQGRARSSSPRHWLW